MSTSWTLPAWHAVADLNERDALQDFIYHQSPAGDDEVAWREHLRAAIMVAHEELCARDAREMAQRPLNDQERASVEQYLADVTCTECHCMKAYHRPGCSKAEAEAKHGR